MSKAIKAALALIALIAIAVGVGAVSGEDRSAPLSSSSPDEKTAPSVVPEEERRAYIGSYVRLHDLNLGRDSRPRPGGTDVVLEGLWVVTGTVENTGDRPISKVVLSVHPQNEQDKVLGSYTENIVQGRRLDPGGRQTFKFKIREIKGFAGRFVHSLR